MAPAVARELVVLQPEALEPGEAGHQRGGEGGQVVGVEGEGDKGGQGGEGGLVQTADLVIVQLQLAGFHKGRLVDDCMVQPYECTLVGVLFPKTAYT